MNGIPQPAYVSYQVVVRAAHAQYDVVRDAQTGRAEYGFSIGDALGDTDRRWDAIVRTRDGTTAVKLGDTYATSNFPILNATWSGIDDWLRFGIDGRPATPEPRGVPAASPSPDVRTIAVVHSLSAPAYLVSGGSSAGCDGNVPGRIYYLRAKYDPFRHPATDVTVDDASGTICTIRFALQRNGVVDRDGYAELHLRRSNGAVLVDRGEIAFVPKRPLGNRRVRIFIDYVGVSFPAAPPASAFRVPAS